MKTADISNEALALERLEVLTRPNARWGDLYMYDLGRAIRMYCEECTEGFQDSMLSVLTHLQIRAALAGWHGSNGDEFKVYANLEDVVLVLKARANTYEKEIDCILNEYTTGMKSRGVMPDMCIAGEGGVLDFRGN